MSAFAGKHPAAWRKIGLLLIGVLIIFVSIVDLEDAPPLWWDEGWTLSVARNWVQSGYYGHLVGDELLPPSLSAAFPVVVPIALSFRLFGIGIWQARLPGLAFTAANIAIMHFLSKKIFGQPIAVGTLAVLFLMLGHKHLHPVLIGRQALAEPAMFFFLLAGYGLLFLALEKSPWFILPALIFWGIALRTKAQVPPFWLASLLVPLGVSVYKRWWRPTMLYMIGIVGSLLCSRLVLAIQGWILSGHVQSREPLTGLYNVTALVLDWDVRKTALAFTLTLGLPTLLGLVYAAWKLYRNLRRKEIALDVGRELVRVSLLSLAGSWLAWYLLLGMSYPRYLFPATFLGSMFASALIYEFTEGFSLSKTVMSASGAFLKGKFTGKALRSLLVVLMIAITVPFTLMALYFYYFVLPSSAATTVSEFVDQDLPGDAVIETYESELLFLSDHRWYHFPPDDVSVQMVSRNTYESDLGIDYDPLGADPDYLIQGPFSKQWHLYDDVLASQAFQLLFEASDYRVYQRVRKGARILH